MTKEWLMGKDFIKTLKPESAEEVIDFYLYRPVAFILVRLLARTRITPNIITLAGVFWGLLAGFLLSRGTQSGFIYGAVVYQIANIFDCADGQLARLKSMYSDFGRILDGVVDYINTSAVYIGAFIGILKAGTMFSGVHHTVIVFVLASLSTVFACAVYDKLKSKYMNLLEDRDVVKEDIDDIVRIMNEEKSYVKKMFFSLYLFYLKAQSFFTETFSFRESKTARLIKENRDEYRELYVTKNTVLLKLWSLVGPSTHAFYFLVFALTGKLFWYFLFIVGPLNIVLLSLFIMQYITEKRILSVIKGNISHG